MIDRPTPEILLSAAEVAEWFHVHRNTLRNIPASDLPFTRVGSRGDRRYAYGDVVAYLERRRTAR